MKYVALSTNISNVITAIGRREATREKKENQTQAEIDRLT